MINILKVLINLNKFIFIIIHEYNLKKLIKFHFLLYKKHQNNNKKKNKNSNITNINLNLISYQNIIKFNKILFILNFIF